MRPVSAAAFPALLELSTFDPSNGGDGSVGVILRGISDDEAAARSVDRAGDVNGDGIVDLIIGASGLGSHQTGGAYVLFGRTTPLPGALSLGTLRPGGGGDGSSGFYLKGIDEDDRAGASVAGAGDVNGDGIDDLIVGAASADPNGQDRAGEAYVVFGREAFSAVFPLLRLVPGAGGDGSLGFVLKGFREQDYVGTSVTAAGDINGDGIDDLLVATGVGESYIVFGRTTGFAATFELGSLYPVAGGDGSQGFVLNDFDPGNVSIVASAAGDVNADGIADVMVRGRSAQDNAAFVVFGRAGAFPPIFDLRALDPSHGGDGSSGFVLKQPDEQDTTAGAALRNAGDVNGDGIDDLIVGDSQGDAAGRIDAGMSYVVFGRASGFPAAFELTSLDPAFGGDGSDGFVLRGIDEGDNAGGGVSGAGDVNADGVDDLLVGAPDAHGVTDTEPDVGEAYVVFGSSTGFPAAFELNSLDPAQGGDGSTGSILMGIEYDDGTGASLSAAGDFNGDGIADLILGQFETNSYTPAPGEAYLIFGRDASQGN